MARCYVHTGCMGSGKTDELIRACNQHLRAGRHTIIFRPKIDNRIQSDTFVSKNGTTFNGKVRVVETSEQILQIAFDEGVKAIGIDEGQFFDLGLARFLVRLYTVGIICTYAGLDTDYLGRPFPTTREVLCLPEAKIYRWKAICDGCGDKATRSIKRLPDNTIVTPSMESQVIEVGESQYNSVCVPCFDEAMAGTLSSEKFIRLINIKSK